MLVAGAAWAKGERSGAFDYFEMALSWSPNWCAREGDAKNSPQCDARHDHGWILHGLDPGRTWRWAQGRSGQLVEFQTHAFGEEALLDLPALGFNAQSLNYLNFLIVDPIYAAALYRDGVLVQIPRSERYAIHKLIVADRRRGRADQIKAIKDREQAAFLIAVLAEDRPVALAEAYHDALAPGPKW